MTDSILKQTKEFLQADDYEVKETKVDERFGEITVLQNKYSGE